MRIVIDLQGAQTGSAKRGIGRYSLELTKGMLRHKGEHEIIIALSGLFPDSIAPVRRALDGLIADDRIVIWQAAASAVFGDGTDIWRRRAGELAREAFLLGLEPDVLLVTSLIEGFNEDAITSVATFPFSPPTALILYDLIPLLYPKIYTDFEPVRNWYNEKVEHLKRGDLWLSISGSAGAEGVALLNLDSSRVFNISTAASDAFVPVKYSSAEAEALCRSLGISRPFILTTGGGEPRKNLDKLLQAFAGLGERLDKDSQIQLVVYGCTKPTDRLLLEGWRAKSSIKKDRVVILDHIGDDDLIALYNLCELFVFPSWHEGFGLPALEAMQCGAPTIAARTSSLPEVIGREDALFDPHNVTEMREKIAKVLNDPALRAALAEHGLRQAREFSWDATAKRAMPAIESLASTRPRVSVPQQKLYRTLIAAIGTIPQDKGAPSEGDLAAIAMAIAHNEAAAAPFRRPATLPQQLVWRLEGPFDSSYSLALLNRETARALHALGHRVALHSTEGPGDFPPNEAYLRANPDLAAFHAEARTISQEAADVVSRNLYPPRVHDMDGKLNLLHHYAWEESGFPRDWADDFSACLNGVTCLSSHVEKILIDHGVSCGLAVSGCGVDHWERIERDPDFRLATTRSFRFLHVSSCFPRKGADLLLEAYGRSFSSADDVLLAIKTFPNPHNEIHKWLAEAKAGKPDFPDVLIIEDNLTDAQLKALYEQCQVLVAPSKAEGYGLPMAEAILSGLAVITTAWGGQRDFCSEETAWLVDYEFEPAVSHFALYGSAWARPFVEPLAATMKAVHETPPAERQMRIARGRQRLLETSRWTHVADRLVTAARTFAAEGATPRPKVAWVSTWNTRCGIASYSAHLLRNMSSDITILAPTNQELTQVDGENVIRCWRSNAGDDLDGLAEVIRDKDFDTVVVQFNNSFYEFDAFGAFLNKLHEQRRTVVVTLHATADPEGDPEWAKRKRLALLRDPLSRCARILVHAVPDLNRLKALGLVDNVALFPHGILDIPAVEDSRPAKDRSFVIGSYGFFLPHKGLLELIEAVALLRQRGGVPVKLHMANAEYPVNLSTALISDARRLVAERGLKDYVTIDAAFRTDDQSLAILRRTDLLAFPYQQTAESASGAVRYGLAVGKPVAVTPLPIFHDLGAAVFHLPGCSPAEIADGIAHIREEMLAGSADYDKVMQEAERWREAHRYSRLGPRLDGILTALARKHRRAR